MVAPATAPIASPSPREETSAPSSLATAIAAAMAIITGTPAYADTWPLKT